MRPARQPVDPYAVLGVEPGATRAEIRRAYRRRALEVHPDVAGVDTTAEMAALNDARDRLLARTPGRRPRAASAAGEPGDEGPDAPGDPASPRRSRPGEEPSFNHAPTWDDYWAAWNDPPRRPPS